MGDSDGRIAVERESVETMLAVLKRLRGIFDPDLAALKENAPGIGAFAERMESGITRLQMVLDNNSEATLLLPREAVETMVEAVPEVPRQLQSRYRRAAGTCAGGWALRQAVGRRCGKARGDLEIARHRPGRPACFQVPAASGTRDSAAPLDRDGDHVGLAELLVAYA